MRLTDKWAAKCRKFLLWPFPAPHANMKLYYHHLFNSIALKVISISKYCNEFYVNLLHESSFVSTIKMNHYSKFHIKTIQFFYCWKCDCTCLVVSCETKFPNWGWNTRKINKNVNILRSWCSFKTFIYLFLYCASDRQHISAKLLNMGSGSF